LAFFLYLLLGIGSVFLIILILIQRGRGGGLAGALGGMGGYSAFGTRAGDIFTRITIVAATVWILAAMLLAWINVHAGGKYENPEAEAANSAVPAGAGERKADAEPTAGQPAAATGDSTTPPAGTGQPAEPATSGSGQGGRASNEKQSESGKSQ
jgi:preprotein translocase subunit SecG